MRCWQLIALSALAIGISASATLASDAPSVVAKQRAAVANRTPYGAAAAAVRELLAELRSLARYVERTPTEASPSALAHVLSFRERIASARDRALSALDGAALHVSRRSAHTTPERVVEGNDDTVRSRAGAARRWSQRFMHNFRRRHDAGASSRATVDREHLLPHLRATAVAITALSMRLEDLFGLLERGAHDRARASDERLAWRAFEHTANTVRELTQRIEVALLAMSEQDVKRLETLVGGDSEHTSATPDSESRRDWWQRFETARAALHNTKTTNVHRR